ncbi:MAG: hypothetical protein ABI647_06050 [Gemmatimonadota bacterium]
MAGGVVALDNDWLAARLREGPGPLADRTRGLVAEAAADRPLSERLAGAAARALDSALSVGASRAAALDLLAADALVTLALEAVAEERPADLAAFALGLRGGKRPA